LERDAAAGGGFAHRHAQARLGAKRQRIAAGSLTGFGAAELEHMPARRLAPEVVIESDDAVHLGARDVQSLGDEGLRSLLDVAEFVLQSVKNRQKRPFAIEVLANALKRDFLVPGNPAQIAGVLMHWLGPERGPFVCCGCTFCPYTCLSYSNSESRVDK